MDQARRIELLVTDDLAQVADAVADLAAHGTPADFGELVAGWTADNGALTTSKKKGPLRCAEDGLRRRVPTMLLVIAVAPAGSAAAAMRDRVTWVHLTGSRETNPYMTPPPGAMASIDLGPLQAFPALRTLSVEYVEDLRGLAALLAAGRLAKLTLQHVKVEELDLSALGALAYLRLNAIPTLRSLRGLPASVTELELYGLPNVGAIALPAGAAITRMSVAETTPLPRPASALTRLIDLRLDGFDAAWLSALTSLQTLGIWGLESTAPLTGLQHLRTLQVWRHDGPITITPLELPALETLELLNIAQLTSLAPLAQSALPKLTTLQLGNDALTSLDGLQAATALIRVEITGEALTDLGAAAAWSELKHFKMHCRSVTDISPLAELRNLIDLDVHDSRALRDLMPLAGLTALMKLNVSDTAATKTSIPENLHPIVHPPSLVAKRSARAPKGAKPVAVPAKGGARTTLAKLKKLLLTRDLDQMNQGLELLRTLADPVLYEGLLSGSTMTATPVKDLIGSFYWGAAAPFMPDTYDVVQPNTLLAYGKPLRVYRQALIHALVAQAPDDCATAAALRPTLAHLFVDASGSEMYNPVDLAPLCALPALTALAIYHARELRSQDVLAGAARLEALALLWCQDPDLSGLASPSLTSLVMYRADRVTALDCAGFPRVERLLLEGNHGLHDVRGSFAALTHALINSDPSPALVASLARSPLERLRIPGLKQAAVLTPLAGCKTLHHLEVAYGNDLDQLAPVASIASLRTLILRRCAPGGLGALAPLRQLEELVVDRSTITAEDARALATLPALRSLVLDDEVTLVEPLPPTLEKICQRVRA